MPDYSAVIAAYKASVNENVTTKNTVNSIDPVDVGGSNTDLADLLLPILNTINNFNILSGDLPPSNVVGNDLDEYYEFGTQLKIYKKYSGVWTLKAAGDLGINIVDGNISLQTSVLNYEVTVSSGNWGINNTIYGKITQDQYTVPTPDLNFDRIDGIFADTGNMVNYVTGVASSTPAEPDTPDSSVKISFVYVPSGASGNLPYVLDSNAPSPGGGGATKTVINKLGSDVISDALDLSAETIPTNPIPYIYINGITAGSPWSYNESTKIISNMPTVSSGDAIKIIFI